MPQIMRDLGKAGLVRTARGFGGGVRLARPARQVSLRAVIEAMQGPVAIYRCLAKEADCPQAQDCRLRKVYQRAQQAMLRVMERTSLEDLIQEQPTE